MIGEGKVGDSNLQTPITTSSMPFMEYVNVQGGSIAQSLE
jgi:hypothetical protein